MIYMLIPLLLIILPMFAAVAVVFLIRLWQKRDGRRSPLSDRLHHGPGEQLRRELKKSDDGIDEALMSLSFIGPFLLCAWALPKLDWTKINFGLGEWILTIFFVGMLLWAIHKITRLVAKRKRLREGLDAELMTAQLLIPLASKGCQVFHDIPADGFNLDHVVIGPHAVYLIETKSRKKAGKGKQSANVEYDGKALRFPDHVSSKPVDQARHEARWLAEFLRGAAGEKVPVVPVVALPGWYVNSTRDAHLSDVVVLNPTMHSTFTARRGAALLSESLRNRVAYALMQRYPAIP
jgi:hypothetical protein